MVWTYHEERLGICRRRVVEMKLPRKEEKREAKEKISRCSEGGYGKVGAREKDIKNKTLWKHHTLWQPLIKGKVQKKKKNKSTLLLCMLVDD